MTSISKHVYLDKVDDIVNKYSFKTIKIKPVDVNTFMYLDFNKENNKEGPKFKLGDNVRVSKYKNILAEDCVPNSFYKAFMIKKVEKAVLWIYVISDLKGEKFVGTFYVKELQKTNQKEFRVEKVKKRKGEKNMLNRQATVVLLTVGLTKKDIKWINEYLPEPKSLEGRVKGELDLSNYPGKTDLKIQQDLIH